MDSVLSQSMYFGLSFSRIGADFRPLIAPVFVRVIVSYYHRALRTAKHRSGGELYILIAGYMPMWGHHMHSFLTPFTHVNDHFCVSSEHLPMLLD